MPPELPLKPLQLTVSVYPYGICLAVSALVVALACAVSAKKRGISPRAVSWFLVLAIPLGLVCSRLGFCVCAIDQVQCYIEEEGPAFLFDFTRGGLLIYGAVLGCTLALLLTSAITRVRVPVLADCFAVPAALMIMLRKLSDYVTGEGYGWSVADWFSGNGMSLFTLEDPSFFTRYPFAVADMYGDWRWAVFILEALIALAIMIILLCRRSDRAGGRAVLLLILYAASQAWCESLRQDSSVLKWGFIRVNQILGSAVLLAVFIACLVRMDAKKRRRRLLPGILLVMLGAVLVIGMEFALEGKISAIENMPMDVCYLISALGCGLVIWALVMVWRPVFVISKPERRGAAPVDARG